MLQGITKNNVKAAKLHLKHIVICDTVFKHCRNLRLRLRVKVIIVTELVLSSDLLFAAEEGTSAPVKRHIYATESTEIFNRPFPQKSVLQVTEVKALV